MRNNTYLSPALQPEKPTLLERARENLRRRDAERAALASIQNRKTADENVSAVSDLDRTPSVKVSSPSLPTPTSTPSPLRAINAWKSSYPGHVKARKTKETKTKNRERAARCLPPRWEKLSEAEKAVHYAAQIIETGNAVAVSILFNSHVLGLAEKAQHGAFQLLRRRVTAALKAAVGRSVSHELALDVTKDGRAHLHGFVDWPSGDLFALRDALKPAAGQWSHKRGREHQIHLRSDQQELMGEEIFDVSSPLTPEFGSYGAKRSKRLRSETNHSTVYASSDVKRQAEAIYNSNRGALKQNKTQYRSINADLQPSNTETKPIVSESNISTDSPVIHIGRNCHHDYADRLTRILRRPVFGHGFGYGLAGRPAYRSRPASPARPAELHDRRSDERRWAVAAARSGRPLRAAPRRADGTRARDGP